MEDVVVIQSMDQKKEVGSTSWSKTLTLIVKMQLAMHKCKSVCKYKIRIN